MTANDQPKIRKSVITKGINRKINHAMYETIDISCNIEQEIEWPDGDPEELLRKSANLNKLLLSDYKKAEDQIMSELELREKNAYESEPKNKVPVTSDLDLDSL